MNDYLTPSGRLDLRFDPAIYFDTSVLIDYWLTAGMENWVDGTDHEISDAESKINLAIKEVLKRADFSLAKMAEVRKRLNGSAKANALVTPLSLLELMEWRAENAFREHATGSVGAMLVINRSRKEIGHYLKKAYEMHRDEARYRRESRTPSEDPTGLELFMKDARPERAFADNNGFKGLLQVDILNFNFSIDKTWQEASVFAYLQLGMADILHLMLAKHLGCKYIASFDSDFERAREFIESDLGLILLKHPEEILMVL
jgi:hypothetical protein